MTPTTPATEMIYLEPKSAIKAINARMSERAFQWRVVALARQLGWVEFHQFDSRRSREGWPDLVLIRRPRILFLELKSESGKATEPQLETLAALQDCGLDARLVRPSDWEAIQETLR